MKRHPILWCILGFMVLGLPLAGCGKKVWPKPVAREDVFSWGEIGARRVRDCLIADARLTGGWGSLDHVELQAEPVGPGHDCPDCPFVPRTVVDLRESSPMFGQDGPSLKIQYCGLPDADLRFRLVAYNRFTTIPPEFSPVRTLSR
jgi:hypothetical protein